MSAVINGKTCYATVGNMSLSGTFLTLRLMSQKADAAAIFGYFVDQSWYGTVGTAASGDTFAVNGAFQKDRSSVQMKEAYADITLVFNQQSVRQLVITTGSSARYDPVYNLETSVDQRPIEQHPRFVCMWAYNLYELVPLGESGSTLPGWSTTETNPSAIHAGYLWSRTPPASPDPTKEYVQVQAATKFGVDNYLIPRAVVTSITYYKISQVRTSDIQYVGKLKAPDEVFIYTNTQSCWLVTNCSVAPATDDLKAVMATYTYVPEGWDTDIYDLATAGS